MASETTELLRKAERWGWETHRGNRHYRLRHPDIPGAQVMVPVSPSCSRNTKNTVALLRRVMTQHNITFVR